MPEEGRYNFFLSEPTLTCLGLNDLKMSISNLGKIFKKFNYIASHVKCLHISHVVQCIVHIHLITQMF
jgi:hypothetical protein